MGIDILNSLADLKGNYRGAVLLSYTLDLLFFEEMVAPKLDALGCTNVVILADQHGYNEALARGARYLRRVGRQYVCAPVVSPANGVQHAKAILLVGPEHGLLLVGSGNLTMHGIGRNLEQFVRFDLALTGEDDDPAQRYPFATVWQMIQQLVAQTEVASAVTDRLQAIAEHTPWLNKPPPPPPADLRIWHSGERSILSQWQDRVAVTELRLLSPYWNTTIVKELVARFQPQRLYVGVDAAEHRLNGADLQNVAEESGCELQLTAVTGPIDDQRILHAKTFIGLKRDGAWCVTGSANCTWRALSVSWPDGGNLELVVWQASTDPARFDNVWANDLLTTHALDAAAVQAAELEEAETSTTSPLRLRELRYEHEKLHGSIALDRDNDSELSGVLASQNGDWRLELRRSGQQYAVFPNQAGNFVLDMADKLEGCEAGRLIWLSPETGEQVSPFRWIDQPAELARFGHRTYHARIQASIQTFAGAGGVFQELLDFLWQRVDPREIQQEASADRMGRGRRHRGREDAKQEESDMPPPPPSAFITDEELTSTLSWHVEGLVPHSHSVYSLRDLLSLALLRLTVETVLPEQEITGEIEYDERVSEVEEIQKQDRRKILQRLSDYLTSYCRRYAARLTDNAFLKQVGPQLLFENHYTLGRILLEFHDKVNLFRQRDLRQCVLWLFGNLFWPAAAGVSGPAGWQRLLDAGFGLDELRESWQKTGLSPLTVLLIHEAWGEPLPWERTKHDPASVRRFMIGHELIDHIEAQIGRKFWTDLWQDPSNFRDSFGFRRLEDVEIEGEKEPIPTDGIKDGFTQLANYQTPAAEKYHYLFLWQKLNRRGLATSENVQFLLKAIREQGYETELRIVRQLGASGEITAVIGDAKHCPFCSIKLPANLIREIKRYELRLCPHCGQTALYWEPNLVAG
jgi:hypothetical protein